MPAWQVAHGPRAVIADATALVVVHASFSAGVTKRARTRIARVCMCALGNNQACHPRWVTKRALARNKFWSMVGRSRGAGEIYRQKKLQTYFSDAAAAGCRLRVLCTKPTGGIELFFKATSATTICSGLLSTSVHRGRGPPSTLGRGPPAYASGPGPRSWSPLASTRALEGDACGLGPAVRGAQGAAHGELRL